MRGDSNGVKINYVEGPETYSSNDVARAFAKSLGKPVEAVQIPREKWSETMKQIGFSEIAAASMVKMTEITITALEKPDSPVRGATTLDEYIAELVAKNWSRKIIYRKTYERTSGKF